MRFVVFFLSLYAIVQGRILINGAGGTQFYDPFNAPHSGALNSGLPVFKHAQQAAFVGFFRCNAEMFVFVVGRSHSSSR